jgi:hypothetical protein
MDYPPSLRRAAVSSRATAVARGEQADAPLRSQLKPLGRRPAGASDNPTTMTHPSAGVNSHKRGIFVPSRGPATLCGNRAPPRCRRRAAWFVQRLAHNRLSKARRSRPCQICVRSRRQTPTNADDDSRSERRASSAPTNADSTRLSRRRICKLGVAGSSPARSIPANGLNKRFAGRN